MTEHQRRALVRILRDEVAHCADRERLLIHARQWLYEHRLLIVHDRAIRTLVAAALVELDSETATTIRASVPGPTLKRRIGSGGATGGRPAPSVLAMECPVREARRSGGRIWILQGRLLSLNSGCALLTSWAIVCPRVMPNASPGLGT